MPVALESETFDLVLFGWCCMYSIDVEPFAEGIGFPVWVMNETTISLEWWSRTVMCSWSFREGGHGG